MLCPAREWIATQSSQQACYIHTWELNLLTLVENESHSSLAVSITVMHMMLVIPPRVSVDKSIPAVDNTPV